MLGPAAAISQSGSAPQAHSHAPSLPHPQPSAGGPAMLMMRKPLLPIPAGEPAGKAHVAQERVRTSPPPPPRCSNAGHEPHLRSHGQRTATARASLCASAAQPGCHGHQPTPMPAPGATLTMRARRVALWRPAAVRGCTGRSPARRARAVRRRTRTHIPIYLGKY